MNFTDEQKQVIRTYLMYQMLIIEKGRDYVRKHVEMYSAENPDDKIEDIDHFIGYAKERAEYTMAYLNHLIGNLD